MSGARLEGSKRMRAIGEVEWKRQVRKLLYGTPFLVAIDTAAIGLSAHAADVQTITTRVVSVHDGDTITALTDDKR